MLMGGYTLLPPSILAKASLRGKEYAWPLDAVEEAIAAGRAAGLVTLGGQVQFRLPDGICELYWISANAGERRPDESWDVFVNRSADEMLRQFREEVVVHDFLSEARSWPFLRRQIDKGVDVLCCLYFVLYFETEESYLRLCGMAENSKRKKDEPKV
jgi:hypothetical protein